MAWDIRGLENPSSDEFLNNPDFRQIVAFFLGWVFFYSGQIFLSSPLIRMNFMRACLSLLSLVTKPTERRHESNDIEAHTHGESAAGPCQEGKVLRHNAEVNNSSTTFELGIRESNTLLVTLTLCFVCASVAHFASLLQYTATGETACAFVVAWGSTAAQAGRLTGLLILSFELKKHAGMRMEIYIFWVFLFAILGLVIANSAISVGTLRPVPSLRISLCYRKHFAPTGLASSLALILAELYLVARFIFFIFPKGLGLFNQLDLLGDSRMYRTLSLLLLEALTITSATGPTNLLVDFVPFSIGAVVVLYAFKVGSPKKEKEVAPSTWSHNHETRRFALHETPAPSIAPTLSIRRMSNDTAQTIALPTPDLSENEPPPAPTRSALSLRVALRDFTVQEQQNSRAVIDGHTRINPESPTFQGPLTIQLPTPSLQWTFSTPSGNSGTQSTRLPPRKAQRSGTTLIFDPDEQAPDVPQSPESFVTPDSGACAASLLPMRPPKQRNHRTKRSSTSSGLTYLTPISQKIVSNRRPSYLLSPSRSFQQSMVSTPHTPIPTWEEMYRHQGLQIDPKFEIPPVPARSDSLSGQFAPPRSAAVPFVLPIARSPLSPPPGLTKFQPITQAALLANTPPKERSSGIRGPRPLVKIPRPRGGTLRGRG